MFDKVKDLLASADIRFGNLECQLSDQGGVTAHPENHLVFTGPPVGADVLKRAHFDIVSTANNHMWDFGKKAFFETLDNLERVGVKYVGAGRSRERAYGPVVVEHHGFKIAFLAITDIWNQGPLKDHVARDFVAMADPELIAKQVRAVRAKPGIDAIVVSYHGGSEYMQFPTLPTRNVLHSAVQAGADVIIGHHPHCVQGISWYRGKPILYSLGNFTMGMHADHPWSMMGYLARITLRRSAAPIIEVCPYRLHAYQPIPLARDPRRQQFEALFFTKFNNICKHVAGVEIEPVKPDGCARIRPPRNPFPGAIP